MFSHASVMVIGVRSDLFKNVQTENRSEKLF